MELYWNVAQPLSEQFEIVEAVHDDRRWDAYGRSTCFAEGKVMRWTESIVGYVVTRRVSNGLGLR